MAGNRSSKSEYECDLGNYLHNGSFDEEFALLTHYIQLGNIPESKKFKEKLEKKSIKLLLLICLRG